MSRPDARAKAPGDLTRYKVTGTAHIALGSVFLLAIVVMANYLAFRHYDRWDWTSSGIFTLSERTERVLERLDRRLDLYVFLSEGEPNFREVRELAERYRAKTDRLAVHYVDPDRRRAEYERLLSRFGVRAAILETGEVLADVAAVISTGKKHWRITRDDLLGLDLDSLDDEGGAKVDVKAERALTGAIVQVTEGRATKVCVTEGHGEWSVGGGGQRSLHAAADELRRDNVEMEELTTLGAKRVPEGCDAVFVVGPQAPFTDDELGLLDRYLRGGGAALLLLDPVFEGTRVEPTGFEAFASKLGIGIGQTAVLELDTALLLTPSPVEPFLVTRYGEHMVTRALRAVGGRTVVHLARSLTADPEGAAHMLLETSKEAYGETDLGALDPGETPAAGPGDVPGPVALALAVEVPREGAAVVGDGSGNAPRGGRLIVMGDSDWLGSSLLGAGQFSNRDLLSAYAGWLTEREALISIAPRKRNVTPVTMTAADVSSVFWSAVVFLPLSILMMGFAVWWSRRA